MPAVEIPALLLWDHGDDSPLDLAPDVLGWLNEHVGRDRFQMQTDGFAVTEVIFFRLEDAAQFALRWL
jgi:hypothetical protein